MKISIDETTKVILLVSSLLLGTSYLDYSLLTRTKIKLVIKNEDKTDWFILFLTRLMITAVTMITISIINIFVVGKLMAFISTTIGIVSMLLMLNIERLPIWEEEE